MVVIVLVVYVVLAVNVAVLIVPALASVAVVVDGGAFQMSEMVSLLLALFLLLPLLWLLISLSSLWL